METKYPKLARTKRKLCYLSAPKSPDNKWTEPLTWEHVEQMFDDLDPSSIDTVPSSPVQTSQVSPVSKDVTEKPEGHQMGPKGDPQNPATSSPSPKSDTVSADLDILFKAPGPIKTSSPIGENMVVVGLAELETGNDRVVSPIIFSSEGGVEEWTQRDQTASLKPICKGHITEESDEELLKKGMDKSCKKSLPIKESTSEKPLTAVLKGEVKAQRKDSKEPVLPAVRQEPEPAAPKKKSESVQKQPSAEPPTRVDMMAYLQMLSKAAQTEHAQKSLSPVRVPSPPPPEPEDDFLILEEVPLWISIPKKNTKRNNQRQNRAPSPALDSSSDKGAKGSPKRTVQKQQKPGTLGLKAGKEVENAEVEEGPSHKHAEKEDRSPLSDKETYNAEAQIQYYWRFPEGDQKRRRKPPKEWWLSCPQQTTTKKSKQSNSAPPAAAQSPVKAKKDKVSKKKHQTDCAPSSLNVNKAKEKPAKRSKNRKNKVDAPDKRKVTEEMCDTVLEDGVKEPDQQQELPDLDQDSAVKSSPLGLSHRNHSLSSGDLVFQRVYHHTSNEKASLKQAAASPRGPTEPIEAAEPEKRRRKPPGAWWAVGGVEEQIKKISPHQQHTPETKKTKPSRRSKLGNPKSGNVAVTLKPQEGAAVSPRRVKPAEVSRRVAGHRKRRNVAATEHPLPPKRDSNNPPSHDTTQDSQCRSETILETLRSGPVPMTEPQDDEKDEENLSVPFTDQTHLCVSDMFAHPLKPLKLQQKHEAHLKELFRSLWPTTDGACEITPEQFDWFYFKGRIIGCQVDLNPGTICNGKILLGSYMEKPLWVDHSATSVFSLLTSSVKVTINSHEFNFNAGQSFMVPNGHAYSIQNVSTMPAVLYFTRILAECLD